MLRELSVQNLALVEDIRVELHAGFCAWTGETGAGKSTLLTALGLILGDKASPDLIRKGEDEARVAAVFELGGGPIQEAATELLGGPIEEGQVIVTRRINRSGRSVGHVNGLPVTASLLKALGALLVDLHAQHENQSLLEPAQQLLLLDDFGNLRGRREQFGAAARGWRDLRQRKAELERDRAARQREISLLQFERDELDAANPQPGEAEALRRERGVLSNVQRLQELAAEGFAALYEADGSAQEVLGRVGHHLGDLAAAEPRLGDLADRLAALADEVRDVALALHALSDTWEADPARLEEVENRLNLLHRLEGKYGRPSDELAAYRAEIDGRLGALQLEQEDLEQIDALVTVQWAEVARRGEDLRGARREVADRFARQVKKQLKDLGMAGADLRVLIEPLTVDGEAPARLSESGLDRVEVLLAPNPGEELLPLRRIASAGELSRVMLAIKTVLAAADRTPTLIFDEVDANVGGRLGPVLGEKLAALGRLHQVICVTHLPQIASFARHQWAIRKQTRKGRTHTTVEYLAGDARLDELATMLRGKAVSSTTRQEAEAMLTEAQSKW